MCKCMELIHFKAQYSQNACYLLFFDRVELIKLDYLITLGGGGGALSQDSSVDRCTTM